MGSINTAPSDNHYHSKQKDKAPIVIVQKDVKPVKYHLMRAYLKLRRLLRPFEATYVFLNDRHSFVKRRQTVRQVALKVPRRSVSSSSSTTTTVQEKDVSRSNSAKQMTSGKMTAALASKMFENKVRADSKHVSSAV